MKILLTSAGIQNQSIVNAMFDLVGKAPEETKVVFIPTAANVEKGDKSWFVDDLVNLKNLNLSQLEIADISAIDISLWKPRFEEADVLFFEGGNMYHLMEWINKSGLTELLPEFLKTKVWVGVSAGSMVTNPELDLQVSQLVYEEDFDKTANMKALGLVDFYFLPHLNSEYFKKVRKENIGEVYKNKRVKVYAMDDNSALKVIDGNVEIISEGKYEVWN